MIIAVTLAENGLTLAVLVASFVLGVLLVPSLDGLLSRANLARPNYRGRPVTIAAGLAVLLAAVVAMAIPGLPFLMGREPVPGAPVGLDLFAFLFGTSLTGLVGLLDDLAGGGLSRGFRGHFRELAGGRVTTGLLKLLFIAFAAVGAGAMAARAGAGTNPYLGAYWFGFVATANAVLVAGTANLFNLLDVRPGRAFKAFLLFGLAYFILARPPLHGYFLAAPLGAGLAAFPADLSERSMLGDTGANFLGYAAATAIAFDVSLVPKLILVIIVLVANVAAERVSLGRLVEANRLSGWVDRLGRRR
ncbi:MAG TPA: hypothetical protein VGL40_14810 [Bacillota bacterium]